MHEWFAAVTEYAVLIINGLALVMVVVGTAEAFVAGMRVAFGSRAGSVRQDVWMRYARWLVAALTFQLAADIIETAITDSWESVARLGAIAVIRTFLNFFLARDVAEVLAIHREHSPASE